MSESLRQVGNSTKQPLLSSQLYGEKTVCKRRSSVTKAHLRKSVNLSNELLGIFYME